MLVGCFIVVEDAEELCRRERGNVESRSGDKQTRGYTADEYMPSIDRVDNQRDVNWIREAMRSFLQQSLG